MKYFFLNLCDDGIYRISIGMQTRNVPLEDLFNYISCKGQDFWLTLEDDKKDPRKIIIWSEKSRKEPMTSFSSDIERLQYCKNYQKYSRKRFAEMPKIIMFRDNYEFLEQQWQEILEREPKYLIFRQHDNGFIDILEKNELSSEDVAIMNRENKIYKNYIKRWNEYVKAHPEKRSDVWRSSRDNEFESDFALYDPIDEQGID